MSIENVEYRKILFTRSDGVSVTVKVNLIDYTNLAENFLVLDIDQLHSSVESDLFYWINKKRWTLNEFIFFTLNNSLCMKIKEKDDTILASYGSC